MRIDHKTMLDAFEETGGRGDVLSIPREDLVRLKSVPVERFAPIFHQLFKWFVDGDETPLEDPIANAMLEGFKEHQRSNARRRKAFLVDQLSKSAKGVEARKKKRQQPMDNPRVIHGQPRVTQVKAKAKDKVRVKEISKDNDISFTVRNDHVRGQQPRTDVSPTVEESVREKSVKEINMIAPPIDEKHYSAESLESYRDIDDIGDFEDADSLLTFALDAINESENPITRNALKKCMGEIGEAMFRRAVFRFDTDMYNEQKESSNDGDEENAVYPPDALHNNPGRHLIARLKRLKEALSALSENAA